MDELIKRLEEALAQEFGHILRPSDNQAWHKVALGLIDKVGLVAMNGDVLDPETKFRLKGRHEDLPGGEVQQEAGDAGARGGTEGDRPHGYL